jgi:uncharacterized protein (DUF697 family)
MHNIGRTVGGANQQFESHEFEGHEFEGHEFEGENEFEFEGEGEFEDEFLHELHGESNEFEDESEMHETSHEAMEMELATELLEVSNEAELEQFLGGLIRKAAGAVKNFAKSSAGKAIGGFLKSAARKALPIAGSALGNMIVPGLGGAIGGKLGSLASGMFELELEGLSNEDKEFELARAYVRFANNAVRKAASNPNHKFQPRRVARAATISAAKKFAPGLLKRARPSGKRNGRPAAPRSRTIGGGVTGAGYGYGGYDNGYEPDQMDAGVGVGAESSSGTWYQQGNQIILNL